MPTNTLSIILLLLFIAIPAGAVTPSQVLVLYNADWREDHPQTWPGQDSREIAEHYVRMHTDPESREKPYILGLSCNHGIKVLDEARHLNESHLPEKSNDNTAGVELAKRRWLVGDDDVDHALRDSRLVEFTLPGGPEGWNRETLQLEIDPDDGEAIPIVTNGLVVAKGQVAGNSGKDWTIRLNAQSFVRGGLVVKASCEDVEGKRHDWSARYLDIADVKYSRTGSDGVRDDQHFLEDVAIPVKAFLEDPDNALPDGTLLKDHILYIVVSYGLPRTTVARYGISRGVTNKLNDHGYIIDFGQRLQLLYYDEEQVMGAEPKPHRFAGKGPFTDFLLRAPQAWPMFGAEANPFVHPLAYEDKKAPLDKIPAGPEFSVKNRKNFPQRHLYFVMRIDAPDPLTARGLIDRAAYATRFGSPTMGVVPGHEYPKSLERVGRLASSKAGTWLLEKDVRHLYYGGQGKNRLELFRLPPGDGFFNTETSYLPGGIAGTVISHNGWKKGEMIQDLARGVTATVGAAMVYRGAPHIHNQSWWDDEVFYPALYRGKTLGEALLMNQVHLGWIATFVGDPLYRLPLDPRKTGAGPIFDPETDVRIRVEQDKEGSLQVWLLVDLGSTPDVPQVAQLRAESEDGLTVACQTFEARPSVKLGEVGEACDARWKVEVIAPFGKSFSANVMIDCDGNEPL
jgi:hypothetical protein